MLTYVCAGHQDESYQENRRSGSLTNGHLRLAVWSVLSYLTVKWIWAALCTLLAASYQCGDLNVVTTCRRLSEWTFCYYAKNLWTVGCSASQGFQFDTLAMMLQSWGPSWVRDSRLLMALPMVWTLSDDSICLIRTYKKDDTINNNFVDIETLNLVNRNFNYAEHILK